MRADAFWLNLAAVTQRHRKAIALVSALLEWYRKNARDLPWRGTRDPYAVWVSEIMLQQTQVKTVLPYWNRWMAALPDIRALARAKPERLRKLWEGLGYYTRVRNLQRAAQTILSRHNGRFPEEFDAVLALPGIGRYTAGAVCSIAFDQAKPILDGNVIRVLTRLFGIEGNPRDKETNARLWQLAEELVLQAACEPSAADGPACSHFNQSLMELGALVCVPRDPRCEICPVVKCCAARRQNRVEQLPNLVRQPPATQRRFAAFVLSRDNRFLVRQRPAGGVNARLWEFPNLEITEADPEAKGVERRKGFRRSGSPANPGISSPQTVAAWLPEALSSKENASCGKDMAPTPMCVIKHSITRYRITLEVFRASGVVRDDLAGRWLTLGQMRRLAFTGAHKRILDQLPEADSNSG